MRNSFFKRFYFAARARTRGTVEPARLHSFYLVRFFENTPKFWVGAPSSCLCLTVLRCYIVFISACSMALLVRPTSQARGSVAFALPAAEAGDGLDTRVLLQTPPQPPYIPAAALCVSLSSERGTVPDVAIPSLPPTASFEGAASAVFVLPGTFGFSSGVLAFGGALEPGAQGGCASLLAVATAREEGIAEGAWTSRLISATAVSSQVHPAPRTFASSCVLYNALPFAHASSGEATGAAAEAAAPATAAATVAPPAAAAAAAAPPAKGAKKPSPAEEAAAASAAAKAAEVAVAAAAAAAAAEAEAAARRMPPRPARTAPHWTAQFLLFGGLSSAGLLEGGSGGAPPVGAGGLLPLDADVWAVDVASALDSAAAVAPSSPVLLSWERLQFDTSLPCPGPRSHCTLTATPHSKAVLCGGVGYETRAIVAHRLMPGSLKPAPPPAPVPDPAAEAAAAQAAAAPAAAATGAKAPPPRKGCQKTHRGG